MNMIRRTKFIAITLMLITSLSWQNLMVQAAYQIPDIGIEYDVSTEVSAGQFVHLPGPVDMADGGTSGRNGYGYVMMPTDLPDQTKLIVSQVHDVDFVTDTNGEQITRCGEAYAFNVQTPDGADYSESFSITLPYCNGLLDPDVYTHDENTDHWIRQNGSFDYSFYDITTEVSELTIHGVFSTEQFGGENEEEADGEGENEDQNEVEVNEDSESDDTNREAEITLNLKEEQVVYPEQTVFIEDTGSRISMPADLPDETTIQVEDAKDTDFVKEADELEVLGDVFTITLKAPEGTSFEGGFTLTLSSHEHAEAIYYYNEEIATWEHLAGEFNDDKSELTIETDHFSTYGVFGKDDFSEIVATVGDDNEDEDSASLPVTSTNLFNWMLIGGVLIVIGFVFLIFKRKRSHKQG